MFFFYILNDSLRLIYDFSCSNGCCSNNMCCEWLTTILVNDDKIYNQNDNTSIVLMCILAVMFFVILILTGICILFRKKLSYYRNRLANTFSMNTIASALTHV